MLPRFLLNLCGGRIHQGPHLQNGPWLWQDWQEDQLFLIYWEGANNNNLAGTLFTDTKRSLLGVLTQGMTKVETASCLLTFHSRQTVTNTTNPDTTQKA